MGTILKSFPSTLSGFWAPLTQVISHNMRPGLAVTAPLPSSLFVRFPFETKRPKSCLLAGHCTLQLNPDPIPMLGGTP